MSYVHAILEISALSFKLVALHEGRLNFKMAARKALIKTKCRWRSRMSVIFFCPFSAAITLPEVGQALRKRCLAGYPLVSICRKTSSITG